VIKINKVIFGIVIMSVLLLGITGISCGEVSKHVGYSVDVAFLDFHHEQYNGVTSWEVVEQGLLSNTVDLHFWDGTTTRLHYVTSVEVID